MLRCFPILSRGIVVGEQQRCLQSEDEETPSDWWQEITRSETQFKINGHFCGNILARINDLSLISVIFLVTIFLQTIFINNNNTKSPSNVIEHSLILLGSLEMNQ